MSELKTASKILTQSWLYLALLISVMVLFPMTEYLVYKQEPLSCFAGSLDIICFVSTAEVCRQLMTDVTCVSVML